MIIKEASTSKKIRNIASENPVATAKQFYDEAAHGGIQHNIYDGKGNIKGYVTKLKDGTTITWRHTSSSDGTPAVDINVKKSTDQAGLEDYYGSAEDIPILSIEKTINLPALEHPVTTPFNRVVKKILIIQENQRLYENDKQIYEVCLTRGVIFDFEDGQLAFEKDNWLSAEIFIRRGYELLNEFALEDEFMKEEWSDGIRGERSRIIEQIPDVIYKVSEDHH